MKIYFTASARGTDKFKDFYKQTYNFLEEFGHQNLDNLVLGIDDPKSFYEGGHTDQTDLYEKAMKYIKSSDVVVLDVSVHSLSMGFVMHKALEIGKPVIALHYKGNSPYFASGIEDDHLQVLEYDKDNLKEVLKNALEFAKDQSDIRFNFFISPSIASYLDHVAKTMRVPRSVYLRRLIEADIKTNEEYKQVA